MSFQESIVVPGPPRVTDDIPCPPEGPFTSLDAVNEALMAHMLQNGYHLRIKRRRGPDGDPRVFCMECSRAGKAPMAKKRVRKTSSQASQASQASVVRAGEPSPPSRPPRAVGAPRGRPQGSRTGTRVRKSTRKALQEQLRRGG
jgi:hypothetical protein